MSKLVPFVFPSSGVSVMIRKVSPLLALEVQRSIPRPKPPTEKVILSSGEESLEPNWSHPDYETALQEYNLEVEEKTKKLLINRGVDLVLTEELKKEVKELRKYMKDEFGTDIALNDKEVYISYIAVESAKDFEALIGAVLGSSQPTEEEVAVAKESFQG